MTDSYVQLPNDSSNTGKKVRTNTRTVDGEDVVEHFNILQDYTSNNQAKIEANGGLRTSSPTDIFTQAIENDSMGRAIYIGFAQPGSDKGDAVWQIRKLTYDAVGAVTDVQFADGTADFVKVWDDRSTGGYVYK